MRHLALVVDHGVVTERKPIHIATRRADTEFDYAAWNAAMCAIADKLTKLAETKAQIEAKINAKIARLERRYYKLCDRKITKKYSEAKKEADKWVVANLIVDQEEKLIELA